MMVYRAPDKCIIEAETRIAATREHGCAEGTTPHPRESPREALRELQEFKSLDDEANIYKLVGPVLLKQDKTEAVLAVDGRLEFIDNEM